MSSSNLSNPIVVAKEANGAEVFLLAELSDIRSKNLNGPAQVHNLDEDEYSDVQPLQVWFKWINWVEAGEEKYRAAVKLSEQERR